MKGADKNSVCEHIAANLADGKYDNSAAANGRQMERNKHSVTIQQQLQLVSVAPLCELKARTINSTVTFVSRLCKQINALNLISQFIECKCVSNKQKDICCGNYCCHL